MGKIYGSSILQNPKVNPREKKIKYIIASNFAQGSFLLTPRGFLAQGVKYFLASILGQIVIKMLPGLILIAQLGFIG